MFKSAGICSFCLENISIFISRGLNNIKPEKKKKQKMEVFWIGKEEAYYVCLNMISR